MTAEPARVTRRTILSGAAAVGAGALLGPAAATGAEVLGDRLLVTRRIGRLAGVSAPIAPPRPFVLAGLSWSRPGHPHIELRTRRPGQPWGRWVPAAVTGHEPDGARPELRFGEPVWCGSSSALQLRSAEAVQGLRVHFVTAEQGAASAVPAAAGLPLAQPVLDAGPGQPPIIARTAWAGHNHPPAHGPDYGQVEMAFVHHSENPNGYSEAEVPRMLVAIYIFHRFVRGWWDIGYNFLIDSFGRIWEGRQGGITQSVMGAQAGGYNLHSTGVAMLGSFSAVLPPPAALDALERLLAWKLSLHGVPILGRVTVRVDPSGAQFTRYRPGQRVSLPRVAGHRDGCTTACPGNALYHHLPAVRPRIAALAGTPAVLTAAGPRTVAPGTTVTISGRLILRGGQPLSGAPVQLQRVGPNTVVAQTSTAADGSWAVTLTATRSLLLCAIHPVRPAAVSRYVDLLVAPQITLAQTATPGVLNGTVSPARPMVTVSVFRRVGAHRRLLSRQRVRTRSGAFSVRPNFHGRHGQFELVAATAAGGGLAAASSAPLVVTR